MLGFGQAAEVLLGASRRAPPLLWRQKDPKPLTPRPASSDETNAGHGRAGQLALLKQGPPVDGSVRLWDRTADAAQGEKDELRGLGSPIAFLDRLGCCERSPVGQQRTMVSHPTNKISEIIWNDYKLWEGLK